MGEEKQRSGGRQEKQAAGVAYMQATKLHVGDIAIR